jgi:dTDP-4-amino-4,6-dideoxygalactose transaminase
MLAPKVPFGDLGRQHASLRRQLSQAFERVLGASSFILGEEVERFEAEFARYCGVEHCVGVASGTAALTIALCAGGVGAGDEVIVPAHTFVATALAVVHAGATPVLCDVSDADGLLDVDHADAIVSERTAAVVPVHLYGQMCPMEPFRALARRHGLLLVEDAAQAHGARSEAGAAGSLGDAAAFSFYPGKNLGALGDGGAICTDDAQIANAARRLRDLGRTGHGMHEVAGFNERLDGLQAAFLRVKLRELDAGNRARRRLAAKYRDLLPDRVRVLPAGDQGCVFHLFAVRTADRDHLRTALAAGGIETGIHYSPALHGQPALSSPADEQAFPRASDWAREELSLPIYPELAEAQLSYVAEQVDRHAV